MVGEVVELVRIEPCREMDAAHAAVERGDFLGASLQFLAAATAAVERAAGAGDDVARDRWLHIADVRMEWARRTALQALSD